MALVAFQTFNPVFPLNELHLSLGLVCCNIIQHKTPVYFHHVFVALSSNCVHHVNQRIIRFILSLIIL